jgi:hypothetical protein
MPAADAAADAAATKAATMTSTDHFGMPVAVVTISYAPHPPGRA